MTVFIIIAVAAFIALFTLVIALCRASAKGRPTSDTPDSDGDFDWSWPPSTTCTGGAEPAAYRSAATSRVHSEPESPVQPTPDLSVWRGERNPDPDEWF
jgi:hypothetical protein